MTLRLDSTGSYLTLTCDVEVERFAELGLGADLAFVGTGVRQLDPSNSETPPTVRTSMDGLTKKSYLGFQKCALDNSARPLIST